MERKVFSGIGLTAINVAMDLEISHSLPPTAEQKKTLSSGIKFIDRAILGVTELSFLAKSTETYLLATRAISELGLSFDSNEELEKYLIGLKSTLENAALGKELDPQNYEQANSFFAQIGYASLNENNLKTR